MDLRWLLRAMLAGAAITVAAPARGQCHYTVTPFYHECPALGSSTTIPTALNDHGDACGYVRYCGFGADLPFVWTEQGGLQLLPLPAGVSSGIAYDIANDGRIVGEINIPGPSPARAFIFDDGEWTILDPVDPSGPGLSVAHAIGEDGTVVGYRTIDAQGLPYNAFTWHPQTGFTDFGLLGGTTSAATAIRNRRVVGWSGNATYPIGFVSRAGAIETLGPIPGGTTSRPAAITSAGIIAGSGLLGKFACCARGFTWDGFAFNLLNPVGGLEQCAAFAISDEGIVLGTSSGGGPARGTLWMNGQGVDVNDLIETELPVFITHAQDVNASGQILARGLFNNIAVAFRLDPIDASPADLDGDCDTDQADMQRLFNDWGRRDSIADLNVDGVVDALDFLFLLAHWSA